MTAHVRPSLCIVTGKLGVNDVLNIVNAVIKRGNFVSNRLTNSPSMLTFVNSLLNVN